MTSIRKFAILAACLVTVASFASCASKCCEKPDTTSTMSSSK